MSLEIRNLLSRTTTSNPDVCVSEGVLMKTRYFEKLIMNNVKFIQEGNVL